MSDSGRPGGDGRANWRFLTNHSAVLLRIAHDPDVRLVDVAHDVGLSPRATQMIVRDLVAGSGIHFEERGSAEFGPHGEWSLYSVGKTKE